MAETQEAARVPDKPRGKTRDAFAYRNRQGEILFNSRAFNVFREKDLSKILAMKSMCLDKLQELEQQSRHVVNHIIRLTRYLSSIQKNFTENKIDAVEVLKRMARTLELSEFYRKRGRDIENAQFDIKFLLNDIKIAEQSNFTKIFSNRLREARKAAKLTQEQVASKIETKRSSYTQYETGTREPSLRTLVQLSKVLNRSADWLLGLTP